VRLKFPAIHDFCRALEASLLELPAEDVPVEIHRLYDEIISFKIRELDRQLVYAYANGFNLAVADRLEKVDFQGSESTWAYAAECCTALDAAYAELGALEAYLEIRRCFVDLAESLGPALSSPEQRFRMLMLLC